MGIETQLDISPFLKTCEDMVQQLHDFPEKMAEEFTNWQRDDMRRQFPETTMPDAHTVQTEIFPRSRVPSRHHPTGQPRGRPVGKARHVPPPQPRNKQLASQRPILRPELYDRMHERMETLLTTIKWKVY